jgi:hypothetical protein
MVQAWKKFNMFTETFLCHIVTQKPNANPRAGRILGILSLGKSIDILSKTAHDVKLTRSDQTKFPSSDRYVSSSIVIQFKQGRDVLGSKIMILAG